MKQSSHRQSCPAFTEAQLAAIGLHLDRSAAVITCTICKYASEIQEGTDSKCVYFIEVSGYDGTVGMDCGSVADDASIELPPLTTWTSWLGSDCDTDLFAGLEENDFRAICIGVNSTAPPATATNGPTTAVTPTRTSGASSMGPTQTGVISSCQQYYTVQSGDSCAAVKGIFAISFADFFEWNPSGRCPWSSWQRRDSTRM